MKLRIFGVVESPLLGNHSATEPDKYHETLIGHYWELQLFLRPWLKPSGDKATAKSSPNFSDFIHKHLPLSDYGSPYPNRSLPKKSWLLPIKS